MCNYYLVANYCAKTINYVPGDPVPVTSRPQLSLGRDLTAFHPVFYLKAANTLEFFHVMGDQGCLQRRRKPD